MHNKHRRLRTGAGANRDKIGQLEALLQQKRKQLSKLERVRRVLEEREQVVSRCISQQVDLLEVLGQLTFSLPEPGDAAYEAKATAAVEALLKDMEVAQLMQEMDSLTTSQPTEIDSAQRNPSAGQHQDAQQQQQQQQRQLPKEEPFNMMIARTFLASPQRTQLLQRISGASVQELAGILREQIMRVGFAVARYPSNSYIDAAAAALEDAAQQHWIQLANERLQAAHNALGTTFLLLHLVRDKVLTLSTLNLETLQPETPPGSFWEEVASSLTVPPAAMAQLHSAFLLYSGKRSQLTSQMQATMAELQQLLEALTLREAAAGAGPSSSSSSNTGNGVGSQGRADAGAAAAGAAGAAGNAALSGAQAPLSDMFDVLGDADKLLAKLSRQVWSLREVSRCLVFQVANVLDPLQMSRATVNSWPFLMQPPPIVEVLVKRHVAQQQQEEITKQQQHERRQSLQQEIEA